jgi:hypothetical protein
VPAEPITEALAFAGLTMDAVVRHLEGTYQRVREVIGNYVSDCIGVIGRGDSRDHRGGVGPTFPSRPPSQV